MHTCTSRYTCHAYEYMYDRTPAYMTVDSLSREAGLHWQRVVRVVWARGAVVLAGRLAAPPRSAALREFFGSIFWFLFSASRPS